MPRIEISSQTAEALERAARERGCPIESLLASLLAVPAAAPVAYIHPLVTYTQSAEYRVKFSDADRLVAVLAWVAAHHPAEFSDFVTHMESRRRYLGMSAEEIRETCRHNHARPIPGTRYWAIMNLDSPTKRRFLRRLLTFVGATDDVIDSVVATLRGDRAAA